MARPERLDDTAIATGLADLPDWERDGNAIVRTYRFGSFVDAIAFVVRLSHPAQAMNHHPELANVYDRVEVRCTTHDADGITRLDLELASHADAAAEGLLA